MRQDIDIDLSRPVTLRDCPELLASFWHWWTRELSSLLPARWRREDGAGTKRNGYFVNSTSNPTNGFAISRIASRDDGDETDGNTARRIEIWLDPALVLRRTVTLPDLPNHRLRSAIELQTDELTPFAAQDVLLDFRVATRDGATQKCTLDAAFLPARLLSSILERLGLDASRIDSVSVKSGPDSLPLFQFKLSAGKERFAEPAARLAVIAFAAIAGLWAMSWSWGYATERERHALESQISALRPQADAARIANDQLTALSAPLAAFAAERPSPSPLYVLSALSAINPESVTISHLEYENGQLRLTGHAKNASTYLELLEKSPDFEQASFSAPMSASQLEGRARFSITLKVPEVSK